MLEKKVKHRANDASNDGHRPPLPPRLKRPNKPNRLNRLLHCPTKVYSRFFLTPPPAQHQPQVSVTNQVKMDYIFIHKYK